MEQPRQPELLYRLMSIAKDFTADIMKRLDFRFADFATEEKVHYWFSSLNLVFRIQDLIQVLYLFIDC